MRNKWTKDSIKGKLVDWFKMPTNLLEDSRIEQLIEHEGMKGLGLYIAIICRMYGKRSKSITLRQLLSVKEKGCTRHTLERIIHDYELFDIDAYDHVTSRIDYLHFSSLPTAPKDELEGEWEKESDKLSDDQSGDHQIEIRLKSDCIPTPARIPTKKEKENKKNDYHHSKKSDDGDDGAVELPSVFRSEPMPRVLMDPIQYILSLPLHSAWAEAMLQTLGCTAPILRQLMMEQWEETKNFFACHAQTQSKVDNLLNENDVKRYFANCLNNPTIARKLQNHLAAKRMEEQKNQLAAMRKLMEQESLE